MSKHTPGPWAYRPSNSGHFIAGAGENSGYLAEVRHCRTNQDVKADAHLIAAAPDLLEALSEFLDGVDPECGDPDCVDCTPYRKARAAIAKAKGGAA